MEELIVETNDPNILDKTIQQFGGLVGQKESGEYELVGKNQYAIRTISGNLDYVEFAIKNQGYGKIIKRRKIDEI